MTNANQELNLQEVAAVAKAYADKNLDGAEIVHKDFKIMDTHHLEYPNHRRTLSGVFKTNHPQSYFDYVQERNAEADADTSNVDRTFIDAEDAQNKLQATTVLNFGTTTNPMSANDLAILTLKKDPVFLEFNNLTDGLILVKDFADALEAFHGLNLVRAFKEDGTEIEYMAAVRAYRNLKASQLKESETKSDAYNSSTSEIEQVTISNVNANLPDFFVLETPLYLNLENQKLVFQVEHKTREVENKAPNVYFRLRSVGTIHHFIKAAENFQQLVQEKVKNTLIGVYQKQD